MYPYLQISTSQRALDVLPSKAFLPPSSRALSCTEEMLWSLIPQDFSLGAPW